MSDVSPSLDRARVAKTKVKELLRERVELRGIGLTRRQGGYAVKVNLDAEMALETAIPAEVDGVLVVVDRVGTVRSQATDGEKP